MSVYGSTYWFLKRKTARKRRLLHIHMEAAHELADYVKMMGYTMSN